MKTIPSGLKTLFLVHFFVALVLGQGDLAESYLAAHPPWDATDRIVTGRDQAGQALVL